MDSQTRQRVPRNNEGGWGKTTLGCLKDYFCFMAAPKQQAGLEGDVPFFFFLISGHERSERKGSSIPQATHARPLIFLFLLFCSATLFYKYGTEGGF